jgi:hypothetical protein
VNSLGDDESDRVSEAYGSNYEALAAIKTVYDPANFFRSNQNVATAPLQGHVNDSYSLRPPAVRPRTR